MTDLEHGAPSDARRLDRLRQLSDLLDSRYRIPGTRIRFGLDGIASIIPGIGDTLTAVVSAYLITEAARMGTPRHLIVRMAGNTALDWIVGSIPVLGTIFDIGFKANNRNVRLLSDHLERRLSERPDWERLEAGGRRSRG